jgi:hypothetical protein
MHLIGSVLLGSVIGWVGTLTVGGSSMGWRELSFCLATWSGACALGYGYVGRSGAVAAIIGLTLGATLAFPLRRSTRKRKQKS